MGIFKLLSLINPYCFTSTIEASLYKRTILKKHHTFYGAGLHETLVFTHRTVRNKVKPDDIRFSRANTEHAKIKN